MKRCDWSETHELFIPYHDEEWGVPTHDNRLLYEMLNLEGAQAGLSWLTVLKKRDHYRKVFDNFDPAIIKNYGEEKRAELMNDAGIIRNRLKINAFIENAKAYEKVLIEFVSFDAYIWSFVGNKALAHKEAERGLEISKQMSKDMLKRGFKFVGPTICYAFMQATGLINDHEPSCFRAKEINK